MAKLNLKRDNIKEFLKTDRAILIICISIAFVFWLFTKLSYEYKSAITVNIEYNVASDKIFTNPPPQVLDIDIGGTGWDLLGVHFAGDERVVEIDATKNEIQSINSLSLKKKIDPFVSDARILDIHPTSIELQTEEIASKEIPIVLDVHIDLAAQHHFADSASIVPRYVKVKGPASIVRDIDKWYTNPVIDQNVKNSFERKVELKTHSNGNIVFEPNEVVCSGVVEQITEKRMEIPIVIQNAPDSVLLILLPERIEVSCIVGLSDYERLSANDFEATVDFDEVDLYKEQHIRIRLKKYPSFATQIQYSPKKADYIIRRESGL
ncbi:MAG: hypothetical protein GY810_24765 [Aureispira sp.]|nr:hypothetical protein [Aureispira sp.]